MTAAIENPADRVRSLIEITESLSEIFALENTALSNNHPSALASLQPEKARLAASYAQSIRSIAANRSALAESADPALLTELRSITRTFEQRAARQRTLLIAVKTRAANEADKANQRPGQLKKQLNHPSNASSTDENA